jgi:SAM-dependent methyltransferase
MRLSSLCDPPGAACRQSIGESEMSEMSYDLETAYEINGAADAMRMYGHWAPTYDESFGAAWGYIAPREIAAILRGEIAPGVEILDIGAGTGLVAEHLRGLTVDALDITPEMLAVARSKGLYRHLLQDDLTKALDLPDAGYDAVVSCGTFTHGHVGPECFPELLRITRPGAVFACGTIGPVLDQAGFGSALARLVALGRITPVVWRDIPIYEGADHPHKDDRGLVMVFRKL